MKDKDTLEARLSGWTPRRPSPQLEHRLFADRCASPAEGPPQAWGRLTPMAGGVLACLAIGGWLLGVWAQGTAQRAEAGLASLTNSMMGWDSAVRANSWGGQRFEWTRPLVFTSSIEPTLGWVTNRLSQ